MNKVKRIKFYLKFLKDSILNYLSKADVFYIVENADWSIKDDGKSIKTFCKMKVRITISHWGIRNAVVHFGSINTFLTTKRCHIPHQSNRIIVTWFHVTPGDIRNTEYFEYDKYVDCIHTSCSITKNKLIDLGIKECKITVIPLGVDTNLFEFNYDNAKKNDSSIVYIGSFQKDGEGWGKGIKPKLVKGPDILLNVLEYLKKNTSLKIEMVLTGPSRGFVINGLEELKIPYSHSYLKNPSEVSPYYKKINYYLVCSREEGGPKSILESMATGIPIISSNVGMAPDIIISGENGFIVDSVQSYAEIIHLLESDSELRFKIIHNARLTAEKFSWKNVTKQYERELYSTHGNS